LWNNDKTIQNFGKLYAGLGKLKALQPCETVPSKSERGLVDEKECYRIGGNG
jgi:hypothetical protein